MEFQNLMMKLNYNGDIYSWVEKTRDGNERNLTGAEVRSLIGRRELWEVVMLSGITRNVDVVLYNEGFLACGPLGRNLRPTVVGALNECFHKDEVRSFRRQTPDGIKNFEPYFIRYVSQVRSVQVITEVLVAFYKEVIESDLHDITNFTFTNAGVLRYLGGNQGSLGHAIKMESANQQFNSFFLPPSVRECSNKAFAKAVVGIMSDLGLPTRGNLARYAAFPNAAVTVQMQKNYGPWVTIP
jgi:hypothetical protein